MKRSLPAAPPAAALLFVLFLGFAAWVNSQTPAGGPKDQIARGEYLVTAGGCGDCHTPKVMTPKGPAPDASKYLSGAPADIKIPPIPQGLIAPSRWGALTTNDFTAWAGAWALRRT